jgi:hypothetical protein
MFDMTPTAPESPATPAEIADLKHLAASIIRAQGNRFVKDLLRSKNIRIGTNKDEFEANLNQAIETSRLTLDDVRAWLTGVEGWGNQHVYLYGLPAVVRKELTEARIRQRVTDAGLDNVWNGETVLAFPDEPALTSISFNNSVLRLVWQESSPDWTPVQEKNYKQQEGLDLYEYRAFRQVEQRAITRFEAHVEKSIAGLFIADPIQGTKHGKAVEEAKRVLALLLDINALESGLVNIAVVSKNLDQQSVPNNNSASTQVKTQRSRLMSGGAYVEFAANSRDMAYWEEPAIQDVRKSVRSQQLLAFQGVEGVFIFQKGGQGLNRPLRVQLYGKENRIRLWALMDATEVWTILSLLSKQV